MYKPLKVDAHGLTTAQLREAERGFTLMLRAKRLSPQWIEENVGDLLAKAHEEYAEKLAKGQPADNPVGWLINCAWRRNQNLLETLRRKPRPSSLETVFHLADETTPTPEKQALDHDRQERLRKALDVLPKKERKLLALVYFEDHSIREAGRKLGWEKSSADRHHAAAMERLRAVVGDRSLLSPATLGLAAFIVAKVEGHRLLSAGADALLTPVREAMAIGTEGATIGVHRIGDLTRRLYPFSDAGSAAASGGVGRTLGFCGAGLAALVCGLGVSAVVGPALGDDDPAHSHRPAHSRLVETPIVPTSTASSVITIPKRAMPDRSDPVEASSVKTADPAEPRKQRRVKPTRTYPEATPPQATNEFGIESESGSTSEAAPTPTPTLSPPPSGSSSPPPRPESSGSSSGSSAASEFGL